MDYPTPRRDRTDCSFICFSKEIISNTLGVVAIIAFMAVAFIIVIVTVAKYKARWEWWLSAVVVLLFALLGIAFMMIVSGVCTPESAVPKKKRHDSFNSFSACLSNRSCECSKYPQHTQPSAYHIVCLLCTFFLIRINHTSAPGKLKSRERFLIKRSRWLRQQNDIFFFLIPITKKNAAQHRSRSRNLHRRLRSHRRRNRSIQSEARTYYGHHTHTFFSHQSRKQVKKKPTTSTPTTTTVVFPPAPVPPSAVATDQSSSL